MPRRWSRHSTRVSNTLLNLPCCFTIHFCDAPRLVKLYENVVFLLTAFYSLDQFQYTVRLVIINNTVNNTIHNSKRLKTLALSSYCSFITIMPQYFRLFTFNLRQGIIIVMACQIFTRHKFLCRWIITLIVQRSLRKSFMKSSLIERCRNFTNVVGLKFDVE